MKKTIFITIDILLILTALFYWYQQYQSYEANQVAIAAANVKQQQLTDQGEFVYCIYEELPTTTYPDIYNFGTGNWTMSLDSPEPSTATSTFQAAQDCFNQFSNNGNTWQ